MLTQLTVAGFSAVPYLETSRLMLTHGKRLKLSKTKPNVLVGPNGSGKSALLTALALRFLAFFQPRSTFDRKYVTGTDAGDWWSAGAGWGAAPEYLKGLNCVTDNAPALYYRPGHIPGNETSVTHAMMTGYFEAAKAYAALTNEKSSGQQSQALQEGILAALSGASLPNGYAYGNWGFGKEPVDLSRERHYVDTSRRQAEVLKSLYKPGADAKPLILMDEPEQSLDAMAEQALWKHIADADCQRMQIIVATHSLYPFLKPRRFNLIETEPGYIERVTALVA